MVKGKLIGFCITTAISVGFGIYEIFQRTKLAEKIKDGIVNDLKKDYKLVKKEEKEPIDA